MSTGQIEAITDVRIPHYEPFGWHHWPAYPWMSYQFRRALGETQEGGGAVSECFLAASRMIPGDRESWHKEWTVVADRNRLRGDEAAQAGNLETAHTCWLRATDYYRSAEFWLDPSDPRRLATFERCEECFSKASALLSPPGQSVEIPYEGTTLYAHFLRPPGVEPPYPVLIAFGGLDSFKEELYFMVGKGMLARGIACLLVDGPGQGGTLRRRGLATRHDYEVPVASAFDYLETRNDVDTSRVAVSGSSLGGYYSARAGSFEHRLAAAISHNGIWNVGEHWSDRDDSHALAGHMKWVFGADSMAEVLLKAKQFRMEGALENMRCPYLILHGGHDVLGVDRAQQVYEYARAHGLDVTLRLVTAEETGAEHCQHDNPTLGVELMGDWLANRFGIDQRGLLDRRTAALDLGAG